MSASMGAWAEVAAGVADAGARAGAREALAASTKKTLRENAPPGVRAGAAAGKGATAGKGEELVSRLLQVTRGRRAEGESGGR